MLAKLKRSTLMQEEQRKKRKRHRKMSYNETDVGERERQAPVKCRRWAFCTQCSAICVLVFFFFLHYTCGMTCISGCGGALLASILLPSSIHNCAIASSWAKCTFPSLDLDMVICLSLNEWHAQECPWAPEPGFKRPHRLPLCLCHYAGKYMFQAAHLSKKDEDFQ